MKAEISDTRDGKLEIKREDGSKTVLEFRSDLMVHSEKFKKE